MEEMNYEVILGMMSEISKKLDVIQVNSKTKEIQPINQVKNPVVSKEEIELIAKIHSTHLGKFIEKTHNQEVEFYNRQITAIYELKKQVKALPAPEKVSLDPLMKLFPKPKKITICGFELLRTSVIIFVLSLFVFFSLVLNIKQMDDYRALESKHDEQTKYILQMWNP
jgi:hypothetical protein